MTDPIHRIVVALDLLEYAEIVLEHALDQARRYEAPDLHFVTVVENPRADLDDAKRRLEALVVPALEGIDRARWRVHLHVRSGRATEEITNLAAEIRAHLLVIGRFGVHHPRRRIGRTANRVIDLATCPTFVVTLTDQSPDAQAQCPDCVALRTSTDGRTWFCAVHAAPERVQLSTIVGPGTSLTGGPLMW